jgi:thioredoxin reductase
MEAFAGRRVLVVGGGDSAVESAVGISHQHGTTVTLSYRGHDFGRIKARNREKLEAAVRDRRVHLLLGSEVLEIRPDAVILKLPTGAGTLPNDDVIVRIGGETPAPFLERCGVRLVKKALAAESDPLARVAG